MNFADQSARFPHAKIIACIFGLYTFLTCPLSFAASFDCQQATTAVELGICGDETISAADDNVATLYRKIAAVDPSAISDQNEWVQDVRNTCQDSNCLSKVYLERIAVLEEKLRTISTKAEEQKAAQERASSAPEAHPEIEVRNQQNSFARNVSSTAPQTGSASELSNSNSRQLSPVQWLKVITFTVLGGLAGRWWGKMNQADVIAVRGNQGLGFARLSNTLLPLIYSLVGAFVAFIVAVAHYS